MDAKYEFDDAKLVELVEKFPFIYDRKDVLFKNKEARNNAWNFIGQKIAKNGRFI